MCSRHSRVSRIYWPRYRVWARCTRPLRLEQRQSRARILRYRPPRQKQFFVKADKLGRWFKLSKKRRKFYQDWKKNFFFSFELWYSCGWTSFLRSSDWSEFTCRHFRAGLSSYRGFVGVFGDAVHSFSSEVPPSFRCEKLFCRSTSTFSLKMKSGKAKTEYFLLIQNWPKTGSQSINRPYTSTLDS